MGILKPVIWLGVAGTIASGAAFTVMGPHRAHALLNSVHGKVNAAIDTQISDPVALRSQLERLAEQYPGRIAEVKGDLAQLQSEIGQLQREKTVSLRVVELAQADLGEMQTMLTKAQDAQATGSIVRVRFDHESLSMDEAYAKANQVSQLVSSYHAKAADIDANLSVLGQQERRLGEILAQLESERAEFQTQLFQLDRQVDAIARNDRMIEMLERREQQFAKYDRYSDVASPDAVKGQIAKVLAEQEARLNDLTLVAQNNDYERQAEAQISQRELSYQAQVGAEIFQSGLPALELDRPFDANIIEITPDSPEAPKAPAGPIASRN